MPLRRIWMFVAVTALGGCKSLDCTPISAAVTGDPRKDIVGTWGDFGIDSPVVFDFRSDGTLHIVEEPNRYAPSGNVSDTTYTVDAAASTYTIASGTPTPFTVNSTQLVELRGTGGESTIHPRLQCKGFGFE